MEEPKALGCFWEGPWLSEGAARAPHREGTVRPHTRRSGGGPGRSHSRVRVQGGQAAHLRGGCTRPLAGPLVSWRRTLTPAHDALAAARSPSESPGTTLQLMGHIERTVAQAARARTGTRAPPGLLTKPQFSQGDGPPTVRAEREGGGWRPTRGLAVPGCGSRASPCSGDRGLGLHGPEDPRPREGSKPGAEAHAHRPRAWSGEGRAGGRRPN